LTDCYTTHGLLFPEDSTVITATNSIAENGSWNDENANTTLGVDTDENWTRIDTNLHPLLTSHAEPKTIAYGIPHTFILGDRQQVIDDVITLKVLTGYYEDLQETGVISNPHIYGYNIKNFELDVTTNIITETRQAAISTFVVTYRRYKPIWVTNLESLKNVE